MDDLIKKIIDIEDRAQAVIADAKKQQQELDQTIEKETRKLERDIKQRADKKSMTIKEFEDAEAERKITDIRKFIEEKEKSLEQKYQNNKDVWVKQIFENIIES